MRFDLLACFIQPFPSVGDHVIPSNGKGTTDLPPVTGWVPLRFEALFCFALSSSFTNPGYS